jgi:glycosyltransferase involved in cell wall biosynthesis
VLMPGGESAEEVVQEFVDCGVEIHLFRNVPSRGRFPNYRGTGDIVRICKDIKIDLIHAHDFISFPACYAAALRTKKGVVFTKAGGPVNNLFPPRAVDAILYSEELLEGMVTKYNLEPNNISLIRARIDTESYKPEQVEAEFMQKYKLPQSGRKIVMATRLEDNKKPWIDMMLNFAERLAEKDEPAHIIIAGEGPLLDEQEANACSIVTKNEISRIVHFIGPLFTIKELNQLYNYADVVVGNGRGILEAMACEKAVVILGEYDEGELVGAENIQDIAYYNFSGRHFRPQARGKNGLTPLLYKLITDQQLLAEAGRFSLDYIKKYMAAEIGANAVLAVYQRALLKKHSYRDYLQWYLKLIWTFFLASSKRRLVSRIPA